MLFDNSVRRGDASETSVAFGRRPRLLIMVLSYLALISIDGLSAATVLINFDERSGLSGASIGTVVPPEYFVDDDYLSLGVLFDSDGGGIWLASGPNPVSPPTVAASTNSGGTVSFDNPIRATFFSDGFLGVVDSVSLTLTDSSNESMLTAFDQEGQVLGSTIGGASETLIVSYPGRIHSVELEGRLAFDDFQFERPVAIPEPSALVLLTACAIFLVGLGRGRRH